MGRLTFIALAACSWEAALPPFKAQICALKFSPLRSPPCFNLSHHAQLSKPLPGAFR